MLCFRFCWGFKSFRLKNRLELIYRLRAFNICNKYFLFNEHISIKNVISLINQLPLNNTYATCLSHSVPEDSRLGSGLSANTICLPTTYIVTKTTVSLSHIHKIRLYILKIGPNLLRRHSEKMLKYN